jgi:ATP-binding cassette subfamily C (CFTR/MRP) protein 1
LFLDTVQGLTTIQAFGWGSEFARRGQKLLNDSQKPLYLLFCVQRWLLLVLSLVAMGLQVLVMGLAVALRTSVSPGLVGLAIVQVTTFSDVMSNLILQWTEMETSLGAVTRISRFTKETPQEPQTNELTGLLKEWPASNSVTLEHVSASYE